MLVGHGQMLVDVGGLLVELVLGKVVLEAAPLVQDLLDEQIVLVEEENDRNVVQVAVDPDLTERLQGLAQAIDLAVLAQRHVERADVDHVDDGRHLVEALDPLAALVSLTAHVEHVKVDVFHVEFRLQDTRGQHTTPLTEHSD